jgi:putative selenate reductase
LYIGIGAQKSKQLKIPGEELYGVIDQLSFLSKIRKKENIILGKTIAVIGGGLSAIDAARTATRLVGKDGKVTMLYRRTKAEMPASLDEITALLDEGVELYELVAPVSIHSIEDGSLSIKCIRMQLQEKDESGRCKSVPITGSEFDLLFDNIVTAVGQDVELDFIPGKKLIINDKTNETQIPNIFAGGDAIRGADSLINAMSDGRKAAQNIIRKSIKKEQITDEKIEQKLSSLDFQKKLSRREYGINLPEIDLEKRNDFELVHPVLDEDAAVKEAKRCLYCNDVCNICVGVCPNFANISFTVDTANIPIYTVTNSGGKKTVKTEKNFTITQKNQILTIGDFCNECGNCNTFCPTSGAPYKTKPMFYLTEESFNNEAIGYYYKDGVLKFKSKGSIEVLYVDKSYLIYESDLVNAKFSSDNCSLLDIRFKSDSVKEINLHQAAEMLFLINNLREISIFK